VQRIEELNKEPRIINEKKRTGRIENETKPEQPTAQSFIDDDDDNDEGLQCWNGRMC
jgi:hypothetical protein